LRRIAPQARLIASPSGISTPWMNRNSRGA
jgi:hypothetical protein